ncbi:hypothetical protein [Sporomusa acidovorans]|uniref:Uncharacterized protein n=1 Tax=Sporomusa acidovorans (strain ATCC 49682 / DSM 3132 / Mol) TaxID=1123286 RepID=A0ABZ3JAQ3_SPOA4|nr:hypothetical protein [Sporomusa acidovorans]OZC18590.1 hypothetical protein SPACI_33110 [Sporomusa acidovorans DSM 3132]SDF52399.1 hypothetical protein SAMN04488499_105522 [Sporomusa acidovorans]
MRIDSITKKKLCPFMSDSHNKVYCTEECALAVAHYDAQTNTLLGTTCPLADTSKILDMVGKINDYIDTKIVY